MKQMRIIQVSSYYPPHLGGQENAVFGLAQQLTKAEHDVHVLTSSNGSNESGSKIENGMRIHRMRSLVFGHAPIMPWLPIALFRTAKPGSVVHLHIGQAFTPEIVWLVSKLRGFAYVAQLHIDFKASGPVGVLLPLYKRIVLKRVLQSAAAVVTLNNKTHQIVRETYQHTGKAVVLNNGLDDAFFKINRKPLPPQPPKVLQLLFVGRFSKQKNIDTLLRACALTSRQVHLDVVGDGDERTQILAAINSLKLKNVNLHGRLGREGVMKLYETCDVLVMPSLYEAQPLVLLEAMAARIPIIGTRVIGVEDHIKDAGILAEPTARGLSDAFEEYYTSYHLLAAMTKKGSAIAEKLRWSHTLKQYEALYEAVAH